MLHKVDFQICVKFYFQTTGPCFVMKLFNVCSCKFRYESEFVLKGYYFVKGHMRITVSQVCRVSENIAVITSNTAAVNSK